MPANRRTWLKQMGLGMAGLGIVPLEAFSIQDQGPMYDHFPKDDITRLSSNENPYGPSPAAIAAMTEILKRSNRYNWNYSSDLIRAIAQKHQLKEDNVLISAGSTELLDLQARYFGAAKGSFVISAPTYGYWSKAATDAGYNKIVVPLTADKKQDLGSILAAIRPDTNMLYLCNPNNPTGTLIPDKELTDFIAEATKKLTVVIDEAYLDYTDQPSAARWVSENKNLVIIKTFSKIYGLAGARIGYLLAHEETVAKISASKTWANGDISLASRVAAMASLKDTAFTISCAKHNSSIRSQSIQKLEKLGLRCIPSHTHFIYFSLENYGKDYFGILKQHKIEGTYMYEEVGKWTRITVGTEEEMKRFFQAIS
ncbi:MAG: histidinol-phosphate aminotransferase family protein [Chitinophagaceae bacterium]|nr:histidinol-phosphate aminotransferase family protein [Chitinophagaceae bacterium]